MGRERALNGVDLLVAGGLTIDRFPDGSAAPGGSVLHALRAAARAGATVAVVTAAGPEPEAADGLREMGEIGTVEAQRVAATLVFHHDERNGVRSLALRGSVRLRPDPWRLRRLRPRALLLAPVAGELDEAALLAIDEAVEARVRVAELQGWLRRPMADGRVAALEPSEIPQPVRARLRNCDALVVSHEDLLVRDANPRAESVQELRGILPGPAIVLTWGGAGYVCAPPDAAAPFAVQRADAIRGVPTVGAGDAFAAILALELGGAATLASAAREADAGVEAWLAAKPGARRVAGDHRPDGT